MAKNTLKPALYYAFRGGYFHGLGYKPVAVTSTKGERLWYGRECGDNIPVHGRLSDLKGRFESEAAAMAVLEGLCAIADKYKPLHEENRKDAARLSHEQRAEERALLKGLAEKGGA